MDIFTVESTHTSGVYSKHPIAFIRGQGAILWDHNNQPYIDCAAGHGVANLGHCHPEIVKAITEQASKLITLPETYYNDRRAELMEKITSLVDGFDRVFFCNSGTEAFEAALKFSRLSTGRTDIIAAMRGFHGRTFGALSATWNKNYRQAFEPLVPGFHHVPFNNLKAVEEAVNENTAAILVEPVQGEGGVHRRCCCPPERA